MSLSQIACSIHPSPTVALNEEARFLRDKGEPVIHLGVGEPKNKTPIAAILSSAAKLNSGEVKYEPTDGTPSLKKAIIRYTEENYERPAAPQNIIISDGAKQSLWNVLFAILNPQDEVIVLAPYWVSYPEMVRMVGGKPVIVTPEDGSFVPSFEEIERVVGDHTKAIIVNSPNNPSGAIYPEELIASIVDLCESQGIYMICDDIYHKLVFDGKVAVPAYKYTSKDCGKFQDYCDQWCGKVVWNDRLSDRLGGCAQETGGDFNQYSVPDNHLCFPGPAGSRRGSFDRHPIQCGSTTFIHAEQPRHPDAGNAFLSGCSVF